MEGIGRRDKKQKTVNFDVEVLEKLEQVAKQHRTSVSNFVNVHIRKIVMDEFELARSMAKYYAGETAKWRLEMDHLDKKR